MAAFLFRRALLCSQRSPPKFSFPVPAPPPKTLARMSPPTRNQTRILWTALTLLAVTVILACIAAFVWALGKALHLFGPVLWPLAIAAVLAYLLDPLVDVLEKRKMKRQRAIIFVFGVALLVVLGFGAAVVPRLVFETRELAAKIP